MRQAPGWGFGEYLSLRGEKLASASKFNADFDVSKTTLSGVPPRKGRTCSQFGAEK